MPIPFCRRTIFRIFMALSFAFTFAPAAKSQERSIDFSRDIRPILSNHCWACHGPDETVREGGLRLDTRVGATAKNKAGVAAIVPGDVNASSLLDRIHATKESRRMPPKSLNKPLNDGQKKLLAEWIRQGAEYAPHWAFRAPVRHEPPKVRDEAWPINPIDRFVLARLEREGLKPSPLAKRETLLRRASLDLTGLPPSPEELDRFLADEKPGAYERAVDRLLASSAYAERMATIWLDAARYADTNGYNNDEERTMWPWREWVIRSFAKNQPFDRFIVEQIAGDLLPGATDEQRLATGFNRNHVLTTEGGIFEDEYRTEYVADRVHTTATVFLGLTMQCARCHEHKYDPLSQREYYQFFAYFNQQPDGIVPYGKSAAAEPTIRYVRPETQAKLAKLVSRQAELEKKRQAREAQADTLVAAWEKTVVKADLNKSAEPGLTSRIPLDEGKGASAKDAARPGDAGAVRGKAAWKSGKDPKAFDFDGKTHIEFPHVGRFDAADAFALSAWVTPSAVDATSAILSRMDEDDAYRGYDILIDAGRVVVHVIHRWPSDGIKVMSKPALTKGKRHHVAVSYDGSKKAAGVKIFVDGKPLPTDVHTDSLKGTIRTDKPFHLGKRTRSLPFKGQMADVRVYSQALSAEAVAKLAKGEPGATLGDLLAIAADKRTRNQHEAIRRYYIEHVDGESQAIAKELAALEAERGTVNAEVVSVMVMKDIQPPRATHILKRGQYDQKLDKVTAGVPSMLPPLPDGAPANRLGLAQWLVRPDHPLTARVAINRWWALLFGAGLVESVEDFGLQGEFPSHPELFDWLSTEFVRSGWDVKHLLKLLVTSQTYRQGARITTEHMEKDPRNRLLARMTRLRLSAEGVRDNALAVSGLLKQHVGGPSVKPYQPAGLWEDVSVERRYKYVEDKGDGLYRRSMYTYWRRTCPPPTMTTFDAPDRETCLVRRARTNTPLQALILLNDPTYVEAARHLAGLALSSSKNDDARVELLFRRAVSRRPTDAETTLLRELVKDARTRMATNAADAKKLLGVGASKIDDRFEPAELAAWTAVASTVLNLDETITRP